MAPSAAAESMSLIETFRLFETRLDFQQQKEIFEKERIDKSEKYDFVIIQWSTIDRWDYPFIIIRSS